MIDFLSAQERLHARSIDFDIRQYLFVLQCAFGESEPLAYALIYDTQEFKKHIGTEEEDEYLSAFKKPASVMLEQQECVHLKVLMEDWLRTRIQNEASNIKTVKYSSEDVANMLSSLLYERSSSLEDASVRDIVTLIRELNSQGALDGSGNGFSKHFINVFPHFNALCPSCNKEIDIARGITCVCPHCGTRFVWSEEDNRFYPQPSKL